jgi:hypothetical protein
MKMNVLLSLKHCGCVSYYMPRTPSKMPICAPSKAECVEEALVIVEETAFDDSRETVTNCQCLPGCTNIEFPYEISQSRMHRGQFIQLPEEAKGELNT